MEITVPDRSIPREILKEILEYEKEAYINLRVGRNEKAEELYHYELALIMEWQKKIDRPIHKGTPLHMIGISLIYQEKIDKALGFFVLAYIEDTLNAGVGLESEADLAPASLALRSAFQIDVNFLKTIKEYIVRLKRRGKWAQARDPSEILTNILGIRLSLGGISKVKYEFKLKAVRKQSIDHLPGIWFKRVFLGGDYDHLPILREIQVAVMKLEFEPIIPYDFEVPEKLIHHHDLMLLHCCRLGIFEVSTPAGQLMEIERAKDYDIDTILFYTDIDGPPHSLSSMIQTAGYTMESYSSIPDLKEKVKKWLGDKI